MKRRLFTLLAALSLLLCVATAGLWICSFWLNFRIEQWASDGYGLRQLAASRGRIAFIAYHYQFSEPGWRRPTLHIGDGNFYDTRAFDDEDWTNVASHRFASWGFAYEDFEQNMFAGHVYCRKVMIPLWLPFVTLAITPGVFALRCALRARAVRRGYCSNCGYDLRATPDRCPECGTVAKTW